MNTKTKIEYPFLDKKRRFGNLATIVVPEKFWEYCNKLEPAPFEVLIENKEAIEKMIQCNASEEFRIYYSLERGWCLTRKNVFCRQLLASFS